MDFGPQCDNASGRREAKPVSGTVLFATVLARARAVVEAKRAFVATRNSARYPSVENMRRRDEAHEAMLAAIDNLAEALES